MIAKTIFSSLSKNVSRSISSRSFLGSSMPKQCFSRFSKQNCYKILNIPKSASKDEIDSAYARQLRQLQTQHKSAEQAEQIEDLKQAHKDAVQNLIDDVRDDGKSNSNQSQQYDDQSQQQDGSNQQKKQGFFKTFLENQNYGQPATKQTKSWGLELAALGIIGVTAVTYFIGSNLKDHSLENANGPRIILVKKDLEEAKYNYAEIQKYKEQYRQEQARIQQEQKQAQEIEQQQQLQQQRQSMLGYGETTQEKSSFEKEFEQYKQNSWGGKSE